MNNSQKLKAAIEIVKTLNQRGYIAYFAGGYVRDLVMGSTSHADIDIATNATPASLMKIFPQTIGVGEQFGVIIVIQDSFPFEVATFRSDIGIKDGRHPSHVVFTDAKTDALRRDFTINGMFYEPIEKQVIDYVGGQEDIQNKKIRAIGDPELRFSEDYLRMMRAVRFSARFNFPIDFATWEAIQNNAQNIVKISAERIFNEVDKMLRQGNPHIAVDTLSKSHLLQYILPEIESLHGIEQPAAFHPEGDVFEHTLKALSLLPHNPSPTLAWSTLLHDIGKPSTMTIQDRIRFNNHDNVGATMAQAILERLRASNALIESVKMCVENHMKFISVTQMRLGTLKKFLSRATIQDELELHKADCLASHGDISNYTFLKDQLSTLSIEVLKPEPIVKGRDLIALGIRPGPIFSEILNEVYELQLDESLHSKEDAIEMIKTKWKQYIPLQ